MRKEHRIISMILVALMLVTAIPFSAVAKTLGNSTYDGSVFDSKNLLIALDNLGDTTVLGRDGVTVSEEPKMGSITVTPNGSDLTVTAKNRTWFSYIKQTNLPLTGTEKYTIQYTGTLPTYGGAAGNEWTLIGFSFYMNTAASVAGDALTLWKSINSSHPNVIKLLNQNSNAHRANYNVGTPIDNNDDFNGRHEYIISIDGKNISFFMDGRFLGTLGGDAVKYSETGMLTLGMRIHADNKSTDTSESKPFTLYSMSNIKVYEGSYYVPGEANYKDGDSLLRLKTPVTATISDDAYNGTDFEDLKVTQNAPVNVFDSEGVALDDDNRATGDDTVYSKAEAFTSTDYWFESGVSTSLPLNLNARYTLEFKVKKHIENLGVGLIFDYVGKSDNNQGVYFYNDSVSTISKDTTEKHKVFGTEDQTTIAYNGVWTKKQDAEGYTQFNLSIDGNKVTVFIGGEEVGSFDFGMYNGSTLGLAIKCHVEDTSTVELKSALVSVKDVIVTAGVMVSPCAVTFEKDGVTIGTAIKGRLAVLSAADFPKIATEDGKIIKWFYKNTNIVVVAPYIVPANVTLEAREIDVAAAVVAGMQYTTAQNGKQSVRFITALHSLQADEIGINVTAVYKDAQGTVYTDKSWNIKSDVVYSSFKVTSASGTVKDVTAEEVGGTYIMVNAINNIPTDCQQIDFYVEAYVVVNGETQKSETVRFTICQGVAAENVAALPVAQS